MRVVKVYPKSSMGVWYNPLTWFDSSSEPAAPATAADYGLPSPDVGTYTPPTLDLSESPKPAAGFSLPMPTIPLVIGVGAAIWFLTRKKGRRR